MKLYALSGTCSLAPHILLQMSGLPFEIHLLDRSAAEHKSPEYLAINPWGKAPVLEDEGEIILENVAIQFYIASRVEGLTLAPTDLPARSQWLAYLAWCSSSVHPSFRRFRRPELYSPVASERQGVADSGKQDFITALSEMNRRLGRRRWVLGDAFTTADAYTHVFHLWARQMQFPIDHLQDLRRHGRAMMSKPAVQAAFRDEALPLSLFN